MGLSLALLGTALLVVAGIYILALGARAWSDAVAAQHRARAHGYEADTSHETLQIAAEALEGATKIQHTQPFVEPSEADLIEMIQRNREFTTEGNEGIELTPPIPPGGQYNT